MRKIAYQGFRYISNINRPGIWYPFSSLKMLLEINHNRIESININDIGVGHKQLAVIVDYFRSLN